MSLISLDSTFLTNPFTSSFNPKRKSKILAPYPTSISSRYSPEDNKYFPSKKRDENQLAKLVMVTLAAGVLTLGYVDPASAAKSGGRIGGQAFKSPSPPPRSSPRINNNSRPNVYINPRVAPPLVGGYGYGGYGVPFYGGWGWSPFSFLAPGPSVAVGVGGGFDTLVLFMVLGAGVSVIRSFFSSRQDDDNDDIDY